MTFEPMNAVVIAVKITLKGCVIGMKQSVLRMNIEKQIIADCPCKQGKVKYVAFVSNALAMLKFFQCLYKATVFS